MLVFRLIVLSCLAVATAAVADEAAEVQKLIRQGDLPARSEEHTSELQSH